MTNLLKFQVNTNGCIKDTTEREYFKKGLAEMVKRLQPQTIINYSQTPDDIFGKYREKGIEIIGIANYAISARKGDS